MQPGLINVEFSRATAREVLRRHERQLRDTRGGPPKRRQPRRG